MQDNTISGNLYTYIFIIGLKAKYIEAYRVQIIKEVIYFYEEPLIFLTHYF